MLNRENKGILTECDALYPFTVQPRVNGQFTLKPASHQTFWQASNLLTGWESPYWRMSYAEAEADAMREFEHEGHLAHLAMVAKAKAEGFQPTCGGAEAYAGTKYS